MTFMREICGDYCYASCRPCTRMLSIAIKNSMILALVILIAHFLLKSSMEEAQAQSHSLRADSLHAQSLYAQSLPADSLSLDRASKEHAPGGDSGDDLYSYVYGPASLSQSQTNTQAPAQARIQHPEARLEAHASLDQGCGSLMAYDGGVSDHWSMV